MGNIDLKINNLTNIFEAKKNNGFIIDYKIECEVKGFSINHKGELDYKILANVFTRKSYSDSMKFIKFILIE